MSDLISTPSQTQSAVSSDAFEALIDLLASDGIDENPAEHPAKCPRPQANVTLRDDSGKLDFDKIRVMFASQNVSKHYRQENTRTQNAQAPTIPNNEDDSDDEPYSPGSTSSSVPSRSESPKLVKQATTGHKRSSTFGNQPWAAIHGNMTEAKEDVSAASPAVLHKPLSFDELNTALASAHEEVKSLRQQYDHLQALVTKRLGTEIRDEAQVSSSAVKADKNSGRTVSQEKGAQAQSSVIVPPAPLPSNLPTEIVTLSEDAAKRALSAIVHALDLSPSTITFMAGCPSTSSLPTSPQHTLSPSCLTQQHDVASIVRALQFLGSVDELVWRRTSNPSGPRTLPPVFSEENTIALLARLELWERTIRRSSRS